MSFHHPDQVLTKSFTPKEPQVVIFKNACKENLVITLINSAGKNFIYSKVIEHYVNYAEPGQKVLCVMGSAAAAKRHAASVRRLTCYSVGEIGSESNLNVSMKHQIYFTTLDAAVRVLEANVLPANLISLLVMFGCHNAAKNSSIVKVVRLCKDSSGGRPRLLGLAATLLPSVDRPYAVQTEISTVQTLLECSVDTTSDSLTLVLKGVRPKECLIEYKCEEPDNLSASIINQVKAVVEDAIIFLVDYQTAIMTYEYDGYEDDLKTMPDPKVEPLGLLNTFLKILDSFGVLAADKAAYVILCRVESLKVRTPYIDAYLLLGLVSTVMVKLRAIFDDWFESISPKDRIYNYCSSQILRLFEVVRQFRVKTEPKEESEEVVDLENVGCVPEPEGVVEKGKGRLGGLRKGRDDVRGRGPRRAGLGEAPAPPRFHDIDPHALCGLILVEDEITARVVFHLFSDLRTIDEDFFFLHVHFTVALSEDLTEGIALERAYRRQELVLRNFRMRDCNLMIGTDFLESGIDLPRCNLVVRFTAPSEYRSYAAGKARAKGPDAFHCILYNVERRDEQLQQLARYHAIEQMLSKKEKNGKCLDGDVEDIDQSDDYSHLIKPFCPTLNPENSQVSLSTAIGLLNRYCAKLPSDTFTRLSPIWSLVTLPTSDQDLYICMIRLPINSPIKKTVVGPAMPTPFLARQFTAFQACLNLHSGREFDDSLMPITKENFWLREEERLGTAEEDAEDQAFTSSFTKHGVEVRPGTSKRRQYYNKKIASCLTDCRPAAGVPCNLYHICMTLTCPLPEEQNTRGRQIKAPEDSPRGFGILTASRIPSVGSFPIFTRAGEVAVELQLSSESVTLTGDQIEKIVPFINFTFTGVLRLQKYLMMFDPNSAENSYFIVPTIKGDSGEVAVDWEFLDLIFDTRDRIPHFIPDGERANFNFNPEQYTDAVVCPWYRNQDHPQYFYVAEICNYLSPKSSFPGAEYETFEDYYLNKYGIQVENVEQALLDVDHTSARLNFLTPRYVNRKGVALPTTSEAKKRAKRENLGQKQILVPELCNVHPFPASLWQKAVCLPCILHRLNSLLLADEVRRRVARDLCLGDPGDPDTVWQPLDFGWNLADVLSKSRAAAASEEAKKKEKVEDEFCNGKMKALTLEETDDDEADSAFERRSNGSPVLEVGTWSNDLVDLPPNVTICNGGSGSALTWDSDKVRYGSPTSWMRQDSVKSDEYDSMSDQSVSDSELDSDLESQNSDNDQNQRMVIEFREDVAEAVEPNRRVPSMDDMTSENDEVWECDETSNPELLEANKKEYAETLLRLQSNIENEGILCQADQPVKLPWLQKEENLEKVTEEDVKEPEETSPFGTANNKFFELADDFQRLGAKLPYSLMIKTSVLKSRVHDEIRQRRIETGEKIITKVTEQTDSLVDHHAEAFSFDQQPVLEGHPGPSPSLILQALTMSNANDGINLERLETIGDSFLKYAITSYLYCTYENVHEGKLSHLRSKQVSNLNLYRLGKQKVFAESMVGTKFEPHDNWLPPCYFVPRELERALIEAGLPASHWNRADLPALHSLGKEEVARLVRERSEQLGLLGSDGSDSGEMEMNLEGVACFIPYNLMTQHSIPDKSVADCVEALIGAYLVACGPRGALLFMSWLGIKVLPRQEVFASTEEELLEGRTVGYTKPVFTEEGGDKPWHQTRFGQLLPPKPPLLRHVVDPEGELARLLTGFEGFEEELHYRFRDRSYLLQAVTHASYSVNQLTDCYQRLEFLGDAVLDYLITRHLFEDPRHHSPGSLTDLRSALVNNTIFASLAVRHNFHKYFRHECPALHQVLDRFVRIQQENNHVITDEYYLVEEDDSEEAEDVEVPKALGDVFESVAGAIYLDSGMSLDAVWGVYYRIMKTEIDALSVHVPKSPVRELLELEPETAQFGKPEKLADGRRVRVAVEVFGKGVFKGIGRNYRIAKCTAAKCALKQLKRRGLLERK